MRFFYEMAKKESITLTDDEKAALKNSEKDFWYDLSDIDGAKKLGVEKRIFIRPWKSLQ